MLERRPRVRPERPPEPHRVRDCGRRRRRRLHADVRPRTRVEPAFGAAPERAGARAPRHDAGAEPLATDRGAAYRRPTARPADARAGAGAHTGGNRVAETDADVDPNADTHPGGAGAHPAIAGAGPAGAGAQPYTRADLRLDGMTHPRVPRRWTIRSLAAAVAAGVAIAVPAGIVGAALVAPDAQPPSPTRRVVRAGPALLAVPSGWERAATPAGLGDLNAGRTAVLAPFPGLATSAVVTFGPGDGGSLVPRALRPLIADSLPPPRDASLGGRQAIAYREVLTRRADLRMDVTVLPTTAGMLAVACTSPANSGYDGSRCASSVSSVSVPGATALAPEPSLPLARALPAATAGLDRARVAGRAAFATARTPTAQAAAAGGLAERHRVTARALQAEFGAGSTPVVTALERGTSAYAALRAAALDGSAAGFRDGRRRVGLAEAGLARAVKDVIRRGLRPASVTAAPAAAAVTHDTEWPRLLHVLLVMLVLLASLAAGFTASGPLSGALTRAARRLSAPT